MWSRRLCRVVKRKSCKTYWGDLWVMTAHVSFEVAVPSTLIVTNWAAERSFTSVSMLIHTGERPFSCSVCDYQCRLDCYVTSNDTRVVISHPRKIQKVSGQGDSGRVCRGEVNFLLKRFIIWISANFDNLYRQSNHQSHIFLICSACIVSCYLVSNAMNNYKL